MQFLAELWLPVLLSAVAVFFISSVVHMALPIHKNDHGTIPGEEAVLAAMRGAGLAPGLYMFPACTSMKDLQLPETRERFDRGPVGFLVVRPNGLPSIGPSLLQWFLLSLGISVLAAYVAFHALPAGASFASVVRIAGTVGFAGYGLGAVQESIWKGMPWRITVKFVIEGLVYGLATAAVLAAMWPAAA